MFLLSQYKNKNNIIVAYVNYNVREDAMIDQKIVTNFCNDNNLKLEILSIHEKHKGNFQEWARKKRYTFFKTIYDLYDCDQLIIAQHKDDFIESAIMQWRFHRNPYLFGINKKNKIFGMNICRPILFKYWKYEIYEIAIKNKIPFNDDYTNFTSNYTRNRIRKEFSQFPKGLKEILLKSFQIINIQKSINKINIIKKYFEWFNSSFKIDFLLENNNCAKDLIFKYLIENYDEKINISSNILESIYVFLTCKNGNKTFMLSNNNKIIKFNNNVINK